MEGLKSTCIALTTCSMHVAITKRELISISLQSELERVSTALCWYDKQATHFAPKSSHAAIAAAALDPLGHPRTLPSIL